MPRWERNPAGVTPQHLPIPTGSPPRPLTPKVPARSPSPGQLCAAPRATALLPAARRDGHIQPGAGHPGDVGCFFHSLPSPALRERWKQFGAVSHVFYIAEK